MRFVLVEVGLDGLGLGWDSVPFSLSWSGPVSLETAVP